MHETDAKKVQKLIENDGDMTWTDKVSFRLETALDGNNSP